MKRCLLVTAAGGLLVGGLLALLAPTLRGQEGGAKGPPRTGTDPGQAKGPRAEAKPSAHGPDSIDPLPPEDAFE